MSKAPTKSYSAEFKECAVQLAVESAQPIAPTARDLGVNENTLHTWIGKYHRVERQERQVQDEHLYEELKRLRKETARLKEEQAILKKAAAYFVQPLPCSTPGGTSSTRSSRCVAGVGFWRPRAGAMTNGSSAPPALQQKPISRYRTRARAVFYRGVGPMACVASSIC
jgi:transposase